MRRVARGVRRRGRRSRSGWAAAEHAGNRNRTERPGREGGTGGRCGCNGGSVSHGGSLVRSFVVSFGTSKGVYTPVAIERVRKRLKAKELRSAHCAKECGRCRKEKR